MTTERPHRAVAPPLMRIRWTPEAFSNFETILLNIEQGNPEATQKMADDIYQRLERLVTFPN